MSVAEGPIDDASIAATRTTFDLAGVDVLLVALWPFVVLALLLAVLAASRDTRGPRRRR